MPLIVSLHNLTYAEYSVGNNYYLAAENPTYNYVDINIQFTVNDLLTGTEEQIDKINWIKISSDPLFSNSQTTTETNVSISNNTYQLSNFKLGNAGGKTNIYFTASLSITTTAGTEDILYPLNYSSASGHTFNYATIEVKWESKKPTRPGKAIANTITPNYTGTKTTWNFVASNEDATSDPNTGLSRYLADIMETRTIYASASGNNILAPKLSYSDLSLSQYASASGIDSGTPNTWIKTAQSINTTGLSFKNGSAITMSDISQPDFCCVSSIKLTQGSSANYYLQPFLHDGTRELSTLITIGSASVTKRSCYAGILDNTYTLDIPTTELYDANGGHIELYVNAKTDKYIVAIYYTANTTGNCYLIDFMVVPTLDVNTGYKSGIRAWLSSNVSNYKITCDAITMGNGRYILNADVGDCSSDDTSVNTFPILSVSDWNEKIGIDKMWQLTGGNIETATVNTSNNLNLISPIDIGESSLGKDIDITFSWDGTYAGSSTTTHTLGTSANWERLTQDISTTIFTDRIGIAAGAAHTLMIKDDGTVWAWGDNTYGQLGNGTTTASLIPIQVSLLTDVVAVAAGSHHNLALKSDNSLWGWGNCGQGQLDTGNLLNVLTPLRLYGVVKAISAKENISILVQTNGHVAISGESGGTLPSTHNFMGVAGLSNITAVAAGKDHALALDGDGCVWAWGNNAYGQLGNGTVINSVTPIKVISDVVITQISAGYEHSVALQSNGDVLTWGRNSHGQLGLDSNDNQHSPTYSTFTNITEIYTGLYHTVAIKNDKTVWACGNNSYGQIGDGTIISKTSAIKISNFSNASSIAAGSYNTIMLNTDGDIWAWGNNTHGQLGNGTISTSESTPILALRGITPPNINITITISNNDGGHVEFFADCLQLEINTPEATDWISPNESSRNILSVNQATIESGITDFVPLNTCEIFQERYIYLSEAPNSVADTASLLVVFDQPGDAIVFTTISNQIQYMFSMWTQPVISHKYADSTSICEIQSSKPTFSNRFNFNWTMNHSSGDFYVAFSPVVAPINTLNQEPMIQRCDLYSQNATITRNLPTIAIIFKHETNQFGGYVQTPIGDSEGPSVKITEILISQLNVDGTSTTESIGYYDFGIDDNVCSLYVDSSSKDGTWIKLSVDNDSEIITRLEKPITLSQFGLGVYLSVGVKSSQSEIDRYVYGDLTTISVPIQGYVTIHECSLRGLPSSHPLSLEDNVNIRHLSKATTGSTELKSLLGQITLYGQVDDNDFTLQNNTANRYKFYAQKLNLSSISTDFPYMSGSGTLGLSLIECKMRFNRELVPTNTCSIVNLSYIITSTNHMLKTNDSIQFWADFTSETGQISAGDSVYVTVVDDNTFKIRTSSTTDTFIKPTVTQTNGFYLSDTFNSPVLLIMSDNNNSPNVPITTIPVMGSYGTNTIASASGYIESTGSSIPYNNLVQFNIKSAVDEIRTYLKNVSSTVWVCIGIPSRYEMASSWNKIITSATGVTNTWLNTDITLVDNIWLKVFADYTQRYDNTKNGVSLQCRLISQSQYVSTSLIGLNTSNPSALSDDTIVDIIAPTITSIDTLPSTVGQNIKLIIVGEKQTGSELLAFRLSYTTSNGKTLYTNWLPWNQFITTENTIEYNLIYNNYFDNYYNEPTAGSRKINVQLLDSIGNISYSKSITTIINNVAISDVAPPMGISEFTDETGTTVELFNSPNLHIHTTDDYDAATAVKDIRCHELVGPISCITSTGNKIIKIKHGLENDTQIQFMINAGGVNPIITYKVCNKDTNSFQLYTSLDSQGNKIIITLTKDIENAYYVSSWSPWLFYNSILPYVINNKVDGLHRMEIQTRDYGNNMSQECSLFETIYDASSKKILFTCGKTLNGKLYLGGTKNQSFTNLTLAAMDTNPYGTNFKGFYASSSGVQISLKSRDRLTDITVGAQTFTYKSYGDDTPAGDYFYIDDTLGSLVFYSITSLPVTIGSTISAMRESGIVYTWDKVAVTKLTTLDFYDDPAITALMDWNDVLFVGGYAGNIYTIDQYGILSAPIFTAEDVDTGKALPITSMLIHQFVGEDEPYVYITTAIAPRVFRAPVSTALYGEGWTLIDSIGSDKAYGNGSINCATTAYNTIYFGTSWGKILKYKLYNETETLTEDILFTTSVSISTLCTSGNTVFAGIADRPEIWNSSIKFIDLPQIPERYIIIPFNENDLYDPSPWQHYSNGSTIISSETVGYYAVPTEHTTKRKKYIKTIKSQENSITVFSLGKDSLWSKSVKDSTDAWTFETEMMYIKTTGEATETEKQGFRINDGHYSIDVSLSKDYAYIKSGNNYVKKQFTTTAPINAFSNTVTASSISEDDVKYGGYGFALSYDPGISIDDADNNLGLYPTQGIRKVWNFTNTKENYGNFWKTTQSVPEAKSGYIEYSNTATSSVQNWLSDRFVIGVSAETADVSTDSKTVLAITPTQNGNPRIIWKNDGDPIQINSATDILIRARYGDGTASSSTSQLLSNKKLSNAKIKVAISPDMNMNWHDVTWIEADMLQTIDYATYKLKCAYCGFINSIAVEFEGLPEGTELSVQKNMRQNINIDYIAIADNIDSIQPIDMTNNLVPVRLTVEYTNNFANSTVKLYLGKTEYPLIDETDFLSAPTSNKTITFGKIHVYSSEIDNTVIDSSLTEKGSIWGYGQFRFGVGTAEAPIGRREYSFAQQWTFNSTGAPSRIVNYRNTAWAITDGLTTTNAIGDPRIKYIKAFAFNPNTEVWEEKSGDLAQYICTLSNALAVIPYGSQLVIAGF